MNDARKSAKPPNGDTPVVYVVDDDTAIREALVDLFLSIRTEAKSFESAQDLLENADLDRPGCILLDVRLPGANGLDFQLHLENSATECRSSS